ARREFASIITSDLAHGLTGEAAAARFALGTILVRTASTGEARRIFEAARAGCARSGDRRCEISSRALLAMMDGMKGKFSEAIPAARVAREDARATGDRWCEGYVLSQLHTLYNWADDTPALEAITEPLLAALRDSGNRRMLLTTLTNLAVVAIEALELEKAEAYISEAEGLARRVVGSQLANASIDRTRGYLEETRGDRTDRRRGKRARHGDPAAGASRQRPPRRRRTPRDGEARRRDAAGSRAPGTARRRARTARSLVNAITVLWSGGRPRPPNTRE